MRRRQKKRRGNGEGSIFRRADGRWTSCVTTGFNSRGLQDRKYYYGRTRQRLSRNWTRQGKNLRKAVRFRSNGRRWADT